VQLPPYGVVTLGCYALGMLGYGVMVFPTCPQEGKLLQKVLYKCCTSTTSVVWLFGFKRPPKVPFQKHVLRESRVATVLPGLIQ